MDSISRPALPAQQPDSEAQQQYGEMRYVARHPILNLNGRVHGYELLFRNGIDSVFCGDRNQATRTILDDAVLFGIERFTGGLPAFINCSPESLLEELIDVLPSGMTVIELVNTIEPTPELLAACRRLKGIGYHLALDGFVWDQRMQPLVDLADYIKIDFIKSGAAVRQDLKQRLSGASATLVATKVERQGDYAQACKEGFTLFQGFYFCLPEIFANAKVPANRIIHLQILQHLYRDPIDLQKVAQLAMRDASLTFRLLRLVNSPACAIRQEVTSVEAAIMVIGEATFRRIATLAILSELNAGHPPAILNVALVRARFCELAAPLCGLNPAEQYLLGMISLLPAMVWVPMETLAAQLPLRHEIRQALLGTNNPDRRLLAWLESHERGDWKACDAIVQAYSLDREKLVKCYAEAVAWNDNTLRTSN
jgi:EAL and modified HD-GYP domain-containing signal transduction protein